MKKHNIQIQIKMFKFIFGSLFGIFLCHSFSGLLSIIGVLLIIALIKEVESHRINMAIKNIENRATDLEEMNHHLRMENKELRESADALSEKNDELILRLDAVAMNPNPKDMCVEFLMKTINAKESDLECPVCLDTAEGDIYSCQDQHLLCSSCRPRVEECPECKAAYLDPPRRHRYAEKMAQEVRILRSQLAILLEGE